MPHPAPTPDPASFLPGYDCGHAVGHNEGYRQGHIDGYAAGHTDGIRTGRAQVEAELVDEWATLRDEVMPRLRTATPYANLADRRDQHDRADTQRRTLRERGIA